MTIREVKAHEDEDLEKVREDVFGRACFISKTKPKTQELQQRIVGTITQSRKKFWVVAKPARQVGAEPKVRATLSLEADLHRRMEKYATDNGLTKTDVVEAALKEFLPPPF